MWDPSHVVTCCRGKNVLERYIPRGLKKRKILLQKPQLSSCRKQRMVLASPTALCLNVVCCAVLPNLIPV